MDSVLVIDNTEFDAPPQFAGKWVEVRFHPDHMEESYILHDGEKFPIHHTDRLKNANTRRKSKPQYIRYHVDEFDEERSI